jgi:two-component system chemotaxis response regulator CheY
MELLIVEDDARMRQLVAHAVARAGFDAVVSEAGDGVEALALLSGKRFDLVISDVFMPNLDGRQLLARMRTDPALAGVPVLMITGDPAPALLRELHALGARACLAKPFTPEALRRTLARLLSGPAPR